MRQNPNLINLFIPAHRCDYLTNANRRSHSVPVKNSLFDYSKVEASIRRISIVVDNDVDSEGGGCSANTEPSIDTKPECDNKSLENCEESSREICDCDEEDRFQLLDTITMYLESAVSIGNAHQFVILFENVFLLHFLKDSVIVVRSCEGAMILTSLPTLNGSCPAIKASLEAFSVKIAESKFLVLIIKKAHH